MFKGLTKLSSQSKYKRSKNASPNNSDIFCKLPWKFPSFSSVFQACFLWAWFSVYKQVPRASLGPMFAQSSNRSFMALHRQTLRPLVELFVVPTLCMEFTVIHRTLDRASGRWRGRYGVVSWICCSAQDSNFLSLENTLCQEICFYRMYYFSSFWIERYLNSNLLVGMPIQIMQYDQVGSPCIVREIVNKLNFYRVASMFEFLMTNFSALVVPTRKGNPFGQSWDKTQ